MGPRDKIAQLLEQICDPEIPVLTIEDIGILRDIQLVDNQWQIIITPTYSGCPAMNTIEAQIHLALAGSEFADYKIITRLSPAWTTDWMTETGKKKLEAYGIAPPNPGGTRAPMHCPLCKSPRVEMVSEFGSTACKALWKCTECLEPFDYFKCH